MVTRAAGRNFFMLDCSYGKIIVAIDRKFYYSTDGQLWTTHFDAPLIKFTAPVPGMNPCELCAAIEFIFGGISFMRSYLGQKFDSNDPILISIMDELPLWSAPFGLKLLEWVVMKPNMNVLDLGCGTGFPLIELANRLGPSCRLYGLDPWYAALQRAQLKYRRQDLSNVVLIQGEGEHLPFQDDFFHLIVSNNGINNVTDPETVLVECNRLSQPLAQLIVTVNLPATMNEFYRIFEATLHELAKHDEIAKMHLHIHEKRKPLQQTVRMINKAGFHIEKIYEDNFTLRFLNGSAMFKHFFIQLAFWDSWEKILSPDDRKPIFQILEHKFNKISSGNGALTLTIPYACIDCRKR